METVGLRRFKELAQEIVALAHNLENSDQKIDMLTACGYAGQRRQSAFKQFDVSENKFSQHNAYASSFNHGKPCDFLQSCEKSAHLEADSEAKYLKAHFQKKQPAVQHQNAAYSQCLNNNSFIQPVESNAACTKGNSYAPAGPEEKFILLSLMKKPAMLCKALRGKPKSDAWVTLMKPNTAKKPNPPKNTTAPPRTNKFESLDKVVVDLSLLGIDIKRLLEYSEPNDILRIIQAFRNLHYFCAGKWHDVFPDLDKYPENFPKCGSPMPNPMNLQAQVGHAVSACKKFVGDSYQELYENRQVNNFGHYAYCVGCVQDVERMTTELNALKTKAFEHRHLKFVDQENCKNGEILENVLKKLIEKVSSASVAVFCFRSFAKQASAKPEQQDNSSKPVNSSANFPMPDLYADKRFLYAEEPVARAEMMPSYSAAMPSLGNAVKTYTKIPGQLPNQPIQVGPKHFLFNQNNIEGNGLMLSPPEMTKMTSNRLATNICDPRYIGL